MNQQIQQKTAQLQGIETLLAEASASGFSTDDSQSDLRSITAAIEPATSEVPSSDESQLDRLIRDRKPKSQPTRTIGAMTTKGAAKASPKPQVNAQSVQLSQPKSVKTVPKNSVKGQKPKQTSKSFHSKRPSNSPEELRNLLLPKFEGKTLKDVTAQVLQDANKPIHLNEIITEMYGSLSTDDLKRAKISLMNILSAGRKDGIWRNLGQGKYAATGITES